jgi:hypothetical protein
MSKTSPLSTTWPPASKFGGYALTKCARLPKRCVTRRRGEFCFAFCFGQPVLSGLPIFSNNSTNSPSRSHSLPTIFVFCREPDISARVGWLSGRFCPSQNHRVNRLGQRGARPRLKARLRPGPFAHAVCLGAHKRALRMKHLLSTVLRRLSMVLRSLRTGIIESHQKRKLRRMLKRVGSIRYLEKGIRADRPTTERLLLAMGARRTGSDEWTLN